MMIARATAAVCRGLFPDALAGVSYTPEEMAHVQGVPMDVVEGEVVVMGEARPSDAEVVDLIAQCITALGLSEATVARQCINLYDESDWRSFDSDALEDLLDRLHKKLMQANGKETT